MLPVLVSISNSYETYPAQAQLYSEHCTTPLDSSTASPNGNSGDITQGTYWESKLGQGWTASDNGYDHNLDNGSGKQQAILCYCLSKNTDSTQKMSEPDFSVCINNLNGNNAQSWDNYWNLLNPNRVTTTRRGEEPPRVTKIKYPGTVTYPGSNPETIKSEQLGNIENQEKTKTHQFNNNVPSVMLWVGMSIMLLIVGVFCCYKTTIYICWQVRMKEYESIGTHKKGRHSNLISLDFIEV